MAGLSGWINIKNKDNNTAAVTENMLGDICHFDQSPGTSMQSPQWGFCLAQPEYNDYILQNDDAVVLVYGNPVIVGKDKSIRSGKNLLHYCLESYKNKGIKFLSDVSGPFSLALYLFKENRLLLAIDRIGIQQMHYHVSGSSVVFSTAMPSFRNHPYVNSSIDMQSIYNYIYFHVIPGPDTIYTNVHKIMPGHCLEFINEKVNEQCYWSIEFTNEHTKKNHKELKNEFFDRFTESVKRDVNDSASVGCFLSGGTDSSTVAGFLGDVTGKPAKTYSIGFNEEGYDETYYARVTSKYFKTDHHEYYVTPKDVVDIFPKIASIYGEPFGNSSAVPTYYCAKMAKEDGIKKLLGGDGGDELFGGNERYATQILFSYYHKLPETLRNLMIEPFINAIPFGSKIMPVHKIRRYIEQASLPTVDRMVTYNLINVMGAKNIFTDSFLEQVDIQNPINHLRNVYGGINANTMLNKMLGLDLKITIADNDIPKVSKMCELAGVSVAYPLLSDEMLDFTSRLSIDEKVKRLKLRWFFKKALTGYLPDEVLTKKKHGFGLPFGKWMVKEKEVRDLAFDLLTDFKTRNYVRTDFVENLRQNKLYDHPDYYGNLVWVFMILEDWLKK